MLDKNNQLGKQKKISKCINRWSIRRLNARAASVIITAGFIGASALYCGVKTENVSAASAIENISKSSNSQNQADKQAVKRWL